MRLQNFDRKTAAGLCVESDHTPRLLGKFYVVLGDEQMEVYQPVDRKSQWCV